MRNLWISLFALTISMGSVMASDKDELEKDKKRREEVRSFVRDYNKREGTNFKSNLSKGVKGTEYRKGSTGHSKFGAIDFGTDNISREKSDKFIKEMAARGFRVIDERDAKSSIKGKKGRNVIHIDTYTKDRGGKDVAGTIRKEIGKNNHPVQSTEEQIYYNPEKLSILEKLKNPRREINRTPQSEEVMSTKKGPLGNFIEEDEEEKKPTVDEIRQRFNAKAVENTPAGQQMSEVQKRKAAKEQLNTENQTNAATESQKKKAQGEQVSAKDNFMEAITYFLPSIAGLAVGGMIGGEEGAAQGAQLGMKAGEGYRQSTLAREKFEYQKEKDVADRRQKATLNRARVTKKQQSADWMTKDKKPVVFDPDQGVYTTPEGKVVPADKLMSSKNYRQEINSEFRAAGLKQTQINQLSSSQKTLFQQNAPAGMLRGRLMEVDKVETLIDSGAPFKGLLESAMAKGLGGEVGNLTDSERQAAAQIVGFKGQIANLSEYLTSNLSSMRTDKIKELLKFIKPKLKRRLGKVVSDYADTNAKVLGMDEALVKDYYSKTAGVDIDFGNKAKRSKSAYQKAIQNAKSVEEIEEIKKQFGAK